MNEFRELNAKEMATVEGGSIQVASIIGKMLAPLINLPNWIAPRPLVRPAE